MVKNKVILYKYICCRKKKRADGKDTCAETTIRLFNIPLVSSSYMYVDVQFFSRVVAGKCYCRMINDLCLLLLTIFTRT